MIDVLQTMTVGICTIGILLMLVFTLTVGLAWLDDRYGKDTHKVVLFFILMLFISYPIGKIILGLLND